MKERPQLRLATGSGGDVGAGFGVLGQVHSGLRREHSWWKFEGERVLYL
jgi:hypothetical protein